MMTNVGNVDAVSAFFIKLGGAGKWEEDCINNGTLRLNYHEVPHELCVSGDWAGVRESFPKDSDRGVVTRHIDQVQKFYEEPETTLWITFHSNQMWWCFASPKVTQLPDKSKTRNVVDRWRNKDINGKPLTKFHLSGKLLAVQGFQGTICAVKERDYLLHKINGTSEPHVKRAEDARSGLIDALAPIIKNLHPKDLETLTDLIFRQAGWQRTGVLGEVEKDIDLDLMSPITQERIGIQVKSKTSKSEIRSYREKFAGMEGYGCLYFVTHSLDEGLLDGQDLEFDKRFRLWGVKELAQQAARNGLVDWLIDKAS